MSPREGVAGAAVSGDQAAQAVLVQGSLRRTIATVAIPAVASMLLMTLFTTVDAYWVGRRIGARGLAAVSTSLFWIWMLISIAELTSVGLTAVASRRHGERRPQEAASAVGSALLFALLLGTVVSTAGLLSLDHLFGVMRTPEEVSSLGKAYLGTYLLGAPLIFGFFAVDGGFRASGDTRTPFLLLLCSVAVALVLDPILILGLGPAPALGIAGAAVATIFARAAAFLAGIVLLARRRLVRARGMALRTTLAIARIGLPTALTGIAFNVIYVLLTRITTRFGTPALAALGVGHRVESWSYMIGVGFGVAAAAIVGQNIGAGQVHRAERAGWVATAFATLVGAAAGLLEFAFAEQFAALFTTEPEVIAESARYLRIAAISSAFVGAELVLEGSLGGAGATLPPMLTSTTLTALRIPLAAWAAARWGTAGIWWTISLTAAARGLAMVVIWRSGVWKRRAV
ncbi:MAG TPA: MATE family efflux transporter [Gemmatimonadaceae bacterium]|nr:MATE family efflux transporter [Gemmatimonadaceae bacterium]